MLTYTEQVNMCKAISNLSDATSVLVFKRDLQAGTARFLAKLDRPVDRMSKFTSQVAGQQYYQFPEDTMRPSKFKALQGTSIWKNLTEVSDEEAWIQINESNQTGYPTHFFVRGYDEVGVYPIPGSTIAGGIEMVYEPKHTLLTADDYTTGTIAVTNGSQTVTGTGTAFTAVMANGSYVLQVTDGSDGNYYKISAYTSGTSITLENYYQGITNALATYRIGQISKIPEEYQEAPVDYAMYRHFLEKGENKQAIMFQNLWETSLKDAENTYGMSTGNQIVLASPASTKTYNPFTDVRANQINV